MLHRIRSALVRPGRERLDGAVEVDETTFGGEEAGLAGGRARGEKKTLVGVAVERTEPRGFGRCRMAPLADGSAASLRSFLAASVETGATVLTDGWQPYRPATEGLYVHERVPGAQRERAHELLPGVHKVSSLAKRWLLGTHQGSVEEAHLPAYLNEFVFRFNRRHSRSRGLVFYRVLEFAVAHEPVRYSELVANPRPSAVPRRPPSSRGRPPSQERPPADRPLSHLHGHIERLVVCAENVAGVATVAHQIALGDHIQKGLDRGRSRAKAEGKHYGVRR